MTTVRIPALYSEDLLVLEHPLSPDGLGADLTGTTEERSLVAQGFHRDFKSILGPLPKQTIILSSLDNSRKPFFHAACVYDPARNVLWTTSAPLETSNFSRLPVILISKVSLEPSSPKDGLYESASWQKLRPPQVMHMPACGALYEDGVLWAVQGDRSPRSSGLVHLEEAAPRGMFLSSYYGTDFNSPYDVAVSRDGSVWFTDPAPDSSVDWKKGPELAPRIYRVDTSTNAQQIRAMTDEVTRPLGLALSPDETTLYVADGGEHYGHNSKATPRGGAVYAFDLVNRSGTIFLSGRRLFAAPLRGAPTCVRCDRMGNVWVAAGTNVEVWTPGAILVGVFRSASPVISLCFGKSNDVFICASHTLWHLSLSTLMDS
ncbi:D-lactonohydrolase-like protein-like protein [Stachybotrys elegans]|uniref:D-lactonohydrolase-like protein-like protein n=1 Tax=Stachybotrys elegans TaxID=80388 RepID=A0A8K0STW1_9HYPO|nr:D-lactonohydrolase-like protein-like protein [Stachybotrys elegans]